MQTAAVGLRCIDCWLEQPLEYRLFCPACGGLLEVRYNYSVISGVRPSDLTGPGVWRYAPLLPVPDPEHYVTLHEGATPLVDCPRLAGLVGVGRLLIKFEGANPTGSVKDRAAAVAVSAARAFGYKAVQAVTTGSLGCAVAAYAARAGLRSVIFCDHEVPEPKLALMEAAASALLSFRGGYDEMAEMNRRLVADLPVFDGSGVNPYPPEGEKTVAYEIAEQMGMCAPDYLACPVGAGDLMFALWRGFWEMKRFGWIKNVPTFVAAQSSHAEPVVAALRGRRDLRRLPVTPTFARGIAVGNPGRKGARVLKILKDERGAGYSVSDRQLRAVCQMLVKEEGIWAGPTGCVALAAVIELARMEHIDPLATVVCIVTETGLRTDDVIAPRRPMEVGYDAARAVVEAVLEGRTRDAALERRRAVAAEML